MYLRIAVGAFIVMAGMVPAWSGELAPEEARRFVVGKLFAFNCFEGTHGAGRIQADGSVVGSVQFGGAGPMRNVTLPANTIQVSTQSVCASVRGVPFQPCFSVNQTGQHSFRGAVSGMGFAYCDFTRRGGRVALSGSGERMQATKGSAEPLRLRPTVMATARDE